MKSNSRVGNASDDNVDPNLMLSASVPSPLRIKSAVLIAKRLRVHFLTE